MIHEFSWLIKIAILLIGFFFLNWVITRLIRKAKEKKKGNVALFHSVLLPGRVLLGILLISFCFDVLAHKIPSFDFSAFTVPLRNFGIAICLSWWLFRWKDLLFITLSKKISKTSLPQNASFLNISKKVINVVILYGALVATLNIFGINIVPFLTFGGIGAAAMGFAAKDIFANYVNGFILHLTRPFSPGDLIQLPDKKIQGYVEEIGWCLTAIRDADKYPIFIPNSLFSSILVVNVSKKRN